MILYEIVAGRLPFPGATPADRMVAMLEREPDPIHRSRHVALASSDGSRPRTPSGAIASLDSKVRKTRENSDCDRTAQPLAARRYAAIVLELVNPMSLSNVNVDSAEVVYLSRWIRNRSYKRGHASLEGFPAEDIHVRPSDFLDSKGTWHRE